MRELTEAPIQPGCDTLARRDLPAGGASVLERPAPSPLRVCHMIATLNMGGAERQYVNFLNALPCRHKFAVVLQSPGAGWLADQLDAEIEVHWIPARLRKLPYEVARIAALLRRLQVDVLHTHAYWASMYGALACRFHRRPVLVTSEHGTDPWKRPRHRWVERAIVTPVAAARICVSEEILRVRRDLDGIAAEKLGCIPNGTYVPPALVRPDRQPPVVGTVGRFVEEKDYSTLLRAAAQLRQGGTAFRLCLLGDGPQRGRLQQEVVDLGLETCVTLPGSQRDVASWLAGFDIFAMSSTREGQPLALLEAMAAGLPIVATHVGGIPQTVEAGREGLLVEPRNPGALAEALRQLMGDYARRIEMGARARQRVERDFSIRSVCDRYLRLYEALRAGTRAGTALFSPHGTAAVTS